MSKTYSIKARGDTKSPHILQDEETDKKMFLCSCGCTRNEHGECDGRHATKKDTCCCCDNK